MNSWGHIGRRNLAFLLEPIIRIKASQDSKGSQLLLDFRPVVLEPLYSYVCERVTDHLLEHLERHRGDVGGSPCRLTTCMGCLTDAAMTSVLNPYSQ